MASPYDIISFWAPRSKTLGGALQPISWQCTSTVSNRLYRLPGCLITTNSSNSKNLTTVMSSSPVYAKSNNEHGEHNFHPLRSYQPASLRRKLQGWPTARWLTRPSSEVALSTSWLLSPLITKNSPTIDILTRVVSFAVYANTKECGEHIPHVSAWFPGFVTPGRLKA